MNLKYYKYQLPFKKAFQTSQKRFDHREGLILEYSAGDYRCYGEIAPLPGFSEETLEEVQQTIEELKDEIALKFTDDNPIKTLQDFYKENELPASLQFGLDSVAYQVMAYQKNSPPWDYLFPDAAKHLQVNALESLLSNDVLEKIKQQVSKGYQTIKFKIGLDFETEVKRLRQIRSAFPDLTIRLDANQAWSTETALRHFQKLEPLNIEFCEEPLKNATPENFELLHQHTQLPLALDESLSHHSYWPNLLPYTSYLILKPMLVGSFTKNIETKRLADTHNNKAVFTTSLESGVGRRMTAILAAGLGSSKTAHGLTTGKLLAKDVHSDMAYISKGAYHLDQPSQPRIDFQKHGDNFTSLF